MRVNKISVFLGIIFSCSMVFTQSKIDSLFDSKYERPSITACLLSFPEIEVYNSIKGDFISYQLDSRFNKNSIGLAAIVNSPFRREYIYSDRYRLLQNHLNKLKIGNKVVESWFANGDTFSMNLVAQRGVYNATESDVLLSEQTKRGIFTVKDAGERLIDKSYILVIDFYNYQLGNTLRANSAVIGYVYKLNWTRERSSDFYTNAWHSKDYLDKMDFDLSYVSQVYFSNMAGDFMSPATFINKSIDLALKEAANSIPDLKVKTSLLSTKPIAAEVGLKEGLKIDQKFLVYERYLNRNSKIALRKIGSVRAKNPIADNRDTIAGKKLKTNFYQDAGGKLSKGMLMEKRYEIGLGFSIGWAKRSLQGVILRLDYNVGPWFNASQLKLYTEFHIGSDNFRFGNGKKDYQINTTQIVFGVSKEYVLHKNLHIEPSLGVVYDNTSFQLNKAEAYYITHDSASSVPNNLQTAYQRIGLIAGLRVPIHLTHNLQIVPGLHISTLSFPATGLVGNELPQNLSKSVKNQMQIDDEKADWYKNANQTSDFVKWEILLRLKF